MSRQSEGQVQAPGWRVEGTRAVGDADAEAGGTPYVALRIHTPVPGALKTY